MEPLIVSTLLSIFIEYMQWHRQDGWGGEVRCSHWWVNVAFLHHWAKPSQTVFRHPAIWRWPTAPSGRRLLRFNGFYPKALLYKKTMFVLLKGASTLLNVDTLLTPTNKYTPTTFLSLLLRHGTRQPGEDNPQLSAGFEVKLVRVIFDLLLSTEGKSCL